MAPDPESPTVPASALAAAPDVPFLIVGTTAAGKRFRPSDWAERLAGVMAAFQPPGTGRRSHLAYSSYVLPAVHQGQRCVRVDPRIAEVEPMALAFLINFARDNDLVLVVGDGARGGPPPAPGLSEQSPVNG
jgi:hypothetical protein